ncbi:MAG: beta-galactosidase [Planctomycetota bacterium]|nr:beta-galactosidase [Planctomycetota bacterium]
MAMLRLTVMMAALGAFLAAAPARTEEAAAARVRAALLQGDLPGHDAALAGDLAQALKDAGYDIVPVDVAVVSDAAKLTREQFDMLVLPHARTLPLQTIKPIQEFLKAGGNLIALGLPAWGEPAFQAGGRWVTAAEYERELAKQRADRVVVNFAGEELKNWTRASDKAEAPGVYTIEADAPGKVLHVAIPNMTSWETYGRNVAQPFTEGRSLTCFRAKGTPRTHQLALEWAEKDGSRWIATVALGTEWQWYALPPEAFHAWAPPAGRGGAGDRLRAENAARLTVGVALTHTHIGTGQHEYWFADLGTARNPFGDAAPSTAAVPHIDGLSPGYQFYTITRSERARDVTSVATAMGQALVTPCALDAPQDFLALNPRPGSGFSKGRAWRWQPLLEARAGGSPEGYRGALAALIVNVQGPYRGSAIGAFAPADVAFYRRPAARQLITDVAVAMRRGAFLLEGGSDCYTVREDCAVRYGASLLATRKTLERVRILATWGWNVPGPGGTKGSARSSTTWELAPEVGKVVHVEAAWTAEERPKRGTYWLTIELAESIENKPLVRDRVAHAVYVFRPSAEPEFVTIRDGHFWLKGKPWRAHGVNYMPSSGIGVLDGEYFEYWIDRAPYDPEIVERDLQRIKAMNLNAIAVFIYHRSLKSENLLDLLRRCEVLGLKVNLSLRPGTPMDFRWNEMKEIIEHYDLAKNDTVFAYDLAWEPSHYDHAYQKKTYTKEWITWVEKKYGAIEDAIKAWGVPAPRDDKGVLTVPPMKQLTQDGPWRKIAADYRAFLDDLLREKYAEARRLIRSVDPNHLVSFRMQFAGDPTFNTEGMLPYDFRGLADAVDIWEPEAYGRIGDWEQVKPGEFTAAYARMCNPKLPVVWAEMGTSVWDMNRMAPNPDQLRFAAQYYRDFYRMMRSSGADGAFFWWYPGGLRVNEKSDYGIINPDGTDREVTKVIREEGAAFLSAPLPPPPDAWIGVDRDRDARGLYGIYEQVKDSYWKARGEGKNVGLKNSQQP